MLYNLIGTFVIAGVVILFIWFLRGLMLTPLKKGEHTQLTVLVRVTGREPALEQTVKGLGWLRSNGTLPGTVVLVDNGMDEETVQVAEKLARSVAGVCYRREEVDVWPPRSGPKNCTEGSTP